MEDFSTMTVEQIRDQQAALADALLDRAKTLRADADEALRIARAALENAEAHAAELRAEADTIDPPPAKPRRGGKRTRKPAGERRTREPREPRVSVKGPLPSEAEAMDSLRSADGPVSMVDWAALVGCDKSLLVPVAKTLVDSGHVIKSGEKRGTKYESA